MNYNFDFQVKLYSGLKIKYELYYSLKGSLSSKNLNHRH